MAASLLLSTLIAVVWVRSYLVADSYQWLRMNEDSEGLSVRSGGILTGMGGLGIYISNVQTTDPMEAARIKGRIETNSQFNRAGYYASSPPRYPTRWSPDEGFLATLGFHGRNAVTVTPQSWRRRFALTVPFWVVFMIGTAYPIWRYVAGVLERQREDRLALGLCPRCGVALKDNFSRCPGCDRPVAVARQASSVEA
jgi:hypothetical protein